MLRFIFISLVLFLVGCTAALETAKRARSQNILVDTPFAEGAKCTLTDARGRQWRVRKTPENVTVEDGHSPLQVICKKRGYKTTVETVRESKEELLTIDGERVSMGIYDQFPTKMPRLIPTAIKEASSFVIDPTGSVSTKYPEKITVWMEPKRWKSDDHMREWAYNKEIFYNKEFQMAEASRIKDEERKAIRRSKKHAREEKRKEIFDKSVDIAKKAVDPETYVEFTKTGARYSIGKTAAVSRGAVDTTSILVQGSGHITKETYAGFADMADDINLTDALKWLKEKSKEYEVPWKVSEDSRWKHYKLSKFHELKWVPNWLKLRHSTASKVGNRKPEDMHPNMQVDEQIDNIDQLQPIGDIPPWITERDDFVQP